MLTPEERKWLESNEIYRSLKEKYSYSTLTTAIILTELQKIPKVSYEVFPLIKWLEFLYKHKKFIDVYSQQTDILGIVSDIQRHNFATGMSFDTTNLHDKLYDNNELTVTLAGGVATNQVLLAAAGAGLKNSVAFISVTWDTAPGAAYTFTIHENGSATVLRYFELTPTEAGKKVLIFLDQPTANTQLEIDVGGGAGAEVLKLCYPSCSF